MHPTAQKVADAAQVLGLDVAITEFDASTRTAEEAAGAVGCRVGQIVKSLLFVVRGQPLMVLISGDNRLDEKKLAALCDVGLKQVKRGDADTARTVTGFAIGGIPPFGHDTPLRTYIDADLMQYEHIWAAAGTPHAVFAISPQNLLQATDGVIADVKSE